MTLTRILRLILLCTLTTSLFAQFGGMKIPKATEVSTDTKKAVVKEIKDALKGVINEPSANSSSSGTAPEQNTSTSSGRSTERVRRDDTAPTNSSSSGSSGSSGSSSGGERSRSGSFRNETPSAAELTPRKIQMYVSKIYKHDHDCTFGEDVLNGLKNFDRAAYEAGDAKRGSEPGYVDRNAVNDLNKALADFDRWLDDSKVLQDYSLSRYNEAQGTEAPLDKMKAYNRVVTACEIVKKISPSNATAEAKLVEVRKLMALVEKKMGGSISNEYHRMHLNQMVFSAKPYVPGSEESADIRTSFKAGETVYATLYLGRKVREASESYAQQPIEVRIDNNLRGLGNIWVTTPMQENSYLQFAIVPGQEWLDANYKNYLDNNEKFYSDFLGNLSKELPLKHDIKVTFKFRGYKAEKFNASFSYDCSDGSDDLHKLADKLANAGLNSVQFPAANMNNSALEKEMLSISQKRFPNDTWKTVHIVSKDWKTITNNLTSAIISRELTAAITYTAFDGKCGYEYITFAQEYTGGGKYSNTLRFSASGGGTHLSCDKLK